MTFKLSLKDSLKLSVESLKTFQTVADIILLKLQHSSKTEIF